MTSSKTESLPIQSQTDVMTVRQKARAYALEAKLGVVDQTKLVTAVSELARNTLVYGKGGNARFELMKDFMRVGIRITFEDQGPGIPDIELALQDHYTTGGGMGLGLGGAKRLVDEFEIESKVNEGTRVSITKWH
jgi:serine/threonine-protein kinase RsbT